MAQVVDEDGARHIKGTFFIGTKWTGSWWTDPPTIYYRDFSMAADAEHWPTMKWNAIAAANVITLTPRADTSETPEEGTCFDFVAKVPSDTPLSCMVALTVDGRSEPEDNGHGDELETSFVISNRALQHWNPIQTRLRAWQEYAIFTERQKQRFRRQLQLGPHIESDTIIPIDLHRPWEGDAAINTRPLHFFAWRDWDAHWSKGWPINQGSSGNFGSTKWVSLAAMQKVDTSSRGHSHATTRIDTDKFSSIMVYAFGITGTSVGYDAEVDGVIRDTPPGP